MVGQGLRPFSWSPELTCLSIIPPCHVSPRMRAVLDLVGQLQETQERSQLMWRSEEVVRVALAKGSASHQVRCWAILRMVVPRVCLHRGWMSSGSGGSSNSWGAHFASEPCAKQNSASSSPRKTSPSELIFQNLARADFVPGFCLHPWKSLRYGTVEFLSEPQRPPFQHRVFYFQQHEKVQLRKVVRVEKKRRM